MPNVVSGKHPSTIHHHTQLDTENQVSGIGPEHLSHHHMPSASSSGLIIALFVLAAALDRDHATDETRGGVEEVDGGAAIGDERGLQPQGLQHLHLQAHTQTVGQTYSEKNIQRVKHTGSRSLTYSESNIQ